MRVKDIAFRFQLSAFSFFAFVFLFVNPAYAEREAPTWPYVEKLFLEGRYDRVTYEADKLIETRAVEPGEAYYIKGLSYLKLKKFSEARNCFENVISKFPRSKKIFDANVGIGDSYLLAGDMNSAVKAYNQILSRFTDNKNIAVVHSRLSEYCGKNTSAARAVPEAQAAPKGEKTNIMPKNLPPSPVTQAKDYFSIQVGSFKNRKNAERLAHKLSGAGYDSYMEMPLSQSDNLYRVKIGKCKSKEEAMSLAAKLKRQGYSTRICANDVCR